MKTLFTDETLHRVRDFLDRIEIAKQNEEEWIEASPDIIHHYNRRGMNGAKYFIYAGIKVCGIGELEKILGAEHLQPDQIVHGKTESVIEGRVGGKATLEEMNKFSPGMHK